MTKCDEVCTEEPHRLGLANQETKGKIYLNVLHKDEQSCSCVKIVKMHVLLKSDACPTNMKSRVIFLFST